MAFSTQGNNYHLCIVNLVIGTLYCSKSNYDFGIGRIIKSLEPTQKKLNTDTWFYAKRCFLALLENLVKQMIVIKDTTISEILNFLDTADEHGKNTPTVFNPLEEIDEKHTVSYEARELKRMYNKMI
jgi:tetratricopeptide repeat protein 30